MDSQELIEQIRNQAGRADYLALKVIENRTLVTVVLEGLKSNEAALKFKSLKILNLISAQNPGVLYPYFDIFAKLLDSPQKIFKWNAIDIIANLSAADSGIKFEPLFEKFYALLEEGSLITAGHVVESSAIIVKNNPDLETAVTKALLSVESLPLPTEECRNILRGKVVLTFTKYHDLSGHKKEMLEFAQKLVFNSRPATAAKAQQFIKQCASGDP
jgi:hypothetical protein